MNQAETTSAQPFVSVVVPVYCQVEQLKACLSALSRQSYPASRFEVIVVDNGSPEGVERLSAMNAFEFRLLSESRAGSYAARNCGIQAARGDIVAFTDADCLPEADWLKAGVTALTDDPDAVVVGGAVVVFPRDSDQMTSVEIHQCISAFPQQNYIERVHFAATANMFTYRSLFEKVGNFDESLLSSGDREWGRRVFGQGIGKLIYSASARVQHPARRQFSDLAAKHRRLLGGKYTLARQGKFALIPSLYRRWFVIPWKRWMSCRGHPALRSRRDWWRLLILEGRLVMVTMLEFLRLVCGGQPNRQ